MNVDWKLSEETVDDVRLIVWVLSIICVRSLSSVIEILSLISHCHKFLHDMIFDRPNSSSNDII
jgi:hypothetical protein